MNEEIGYHVWEVKPLPKWFDSLGFTKADGYYWKYVESQMTKDYIKIYE